MNRRLRFVPGAARWLPSLCILLWGALAQAQPGILSGTVFDSTSGEPVIGAAVTIVATEQRVSAGDDGAFRIPIAPGNYDLRFTAPGYSARVLQGVVVGPDEPADASTSLSPTGAVMDVLEVVAQPYRVSEATQLMERREATYVSDNIGAELISQSPDSDAAEVVQRLPAITVRDDKFIVIRGLGERYSGALLNGSRLPSTDPDKRVVSLDLFPSNFIESLSIQKSFSPEFPGDSTALVDIRLKEFPEELTVGAGLSTGGNTQSTFRSFDTYQGSTLDYFGFGNDYRDLPGIIPDDTLSAEATATDSRQRALHSSFRNIWDPSETTAPVDWGTNFSVGNSIGDFGFMFAATYGANYTVRRDAIVRQVRSEDWFETGNLGALYDSRETTSTFETRLGGILTAAYQPVDEHKLALRSFVNRASTDETLDNRGINVPGREDFDVFETNLRYREEQLGFGQLEGTHELPWLDLTWRSALSQTTRNDPDQRFIVRARPQGTQQAPVLINEFKNLMRTFGSLDETMTDSGLDVSVPWVLPDAAPKPWRGQEIKFKTGAAYTYRDRSFEQRRFKLTETPTNLVDKSLPLEQLLVPQNIGLAPNGSFEFGEIDNPADVFDATQNIAAGYGMVEVPLLPNTLRFIGGVRAEYSLIETTGLDTAGDDASTRLEDTDPLPSLNFIYSPREDMNIRYGYSQTVSRPEFRELMETEFPPVGGERVVKGNADLYSTDIRSHDLRWEWFIDDVDLVSVSFFEKEIPDAIEVVTKPATSSLVDSFRNAEAWLWGFELEVRKNLGFLGESIRDVRWMKDLSYELESVSVLGNFSIIESEAYIRRLSGPECEGDPATVPKACSEAQTNESRRMQGQAPYVINLALQYENLDWGTFRLLYNTVGDQIIAAGTDGLDDIIEEPRHQVDFVWSSTIEPFDVPLTTKFAVENILDDDYVASQQDFVVERYEPGVGFGMSVSYSY